MFSMRLVLVVSFALASLYLNTNEANMRSSMRIAQTSCRFLRHVYKRSMYTPQCEKDDSMKNPQCYNIGNAFRVCCCTYKYPIVNRGIQWLGNCTRYRARSEAKPVCFGPWMIRKYENGPLLQPELAKIYKNGISSEEQDESEKGDE